MLKATQWSQDLILKQNFKKQNIIYLFVSSEIMDQEVSRNIVLSFEWNQITKWREHMILIKISPLSTLQKIMHHSLNLYAHIPHSCCFCNPQYTTSSQHLKKQERNEQTAVMKCIIIFSLSSVKLFYNRSRKHMRNVVIHNTHLSLSETTKGNSRGKY